MGIALAFIALFSWGLGDFLIQKSTRDFGDWIALLYIELFGVIVLLPFIWNEFLLLSLGDFIFLCIASIVILFAALFNFEALRIGKISIIEPVYTLEIPVTVFLATFILGEFLNTLESILIILLMLGIFLIATKSFSTLKKLHLEKGVWLAMIGTAAMGTSNFLFGIGSRNISPIMINWFTGVFIVIVCFLYLYKNNKTHEIITHWHQQKSLIVGVSFFDNLAWVTYSISTTYIPIAIATGISESYIGMAAVLGLIYNKEKLARHQWVGLVLSIACVAILSILIFD